MNILFVCFRQAVHLSMSVQLQTWPLHVHECMWECRQGGSSSSAREQRQLSLWKAACLSSRLQSHGRSEYQFEFLCSRSSLKLWNFAPCLALFSVCLFAYLGRKYALNWSFHNFSTNWTVIRSTISSFRWNTTWTKPQTQTAARCVASFSKQPSNTLTKYTTEHIYCIRIF